MYARVGATHTDSTRKISASKPQDTQIPHFIQRDQRAGCCSTAIAIDRGCDSIKAAVEGEASTRKETAVLPVALPARGRLRVELLENKLHAGVHLLHCV